jgi:hypothetical protein
MKTNALFAALVLYATAAGAAGIDMDDPRRALGREGNVRVDAQLLRDFVTPGMPIGFTYQIENLSTSAVAIAHKVTDASYDEDSRTISVTVGSEVPPDGNMPLVVLIAPGEKKVLHAAATAPVSAGQVKSSLGATPRFVQLKVAILRDLRPFQALIEKQSAQNVRVKQRLTDAQFEQWFDSNDTIFLNTVPVGFTPKKDPEAEAREAARGGF